MACDPDTTVTQADMEGLNSDIATIDDVVESSLDTTTTKNGKTINTLLGQLKLLGYIPPVVYAGGILFEAGDNTQTMDRNGIIYAPLPSALPFTTTGTWVADDEDKFFVVQGLTEDVGNLRYSANFASVAAMQSLITLDGDTYAAESGQLVQTASRADSIPFDAINEGSGDEFRVMTLAEYGLTPDEIGKAFTLTGGVFVAVSTAYLAILGRYGNDTAGAQAAIDGGHNLEINKPATFATSVVITTPIRITGQNTKSKITVPTVSATPAFDVSGTGGTTREKIRFEHLDFDGGFDTCIKAVATNPLELNDVRFATGKNALDLSTFFYGSCRDAIFLSSGATLDNINNFDFVGTDANGAQVINDGRFVASDYGFVLNDCDNVSFQQMTFEVWRCNVLSFTACKNIIFDRAWFEGNTADRTILAHNTSQISISNGWFDFGTFNTVAFIEVTSDTTFNSRTYRTQIIVESSQLNLNQSATSSPPFVKSNSTAGAVKADLNISNSTLGSGFIHIPDLNTYLTVKNLSLSSPTSGSDLKKGITAMDTVDVSAGQNSSWTPNNTNSQWDFTVSDGGWTEVVPVGSTISTVTSVVGPPPITGTNALKIATTGAVTSRMNQSVLAGAITLTGETYFLAVKVWSDLACTAKIQLLDNSSVVADDGPTVAIGGDDRWRWLVMKTNSDNMAGILASGLAPILRIDFVTTDITNIYMDRADYQIDYGDHYLP